MRNPYVYAQPVADVANLTNLITRVAAAEPADHPPLIKVITNNEWPLPWYLRGFDRVGYWPAVPAVPDADVAIVSTSFRDDFERQRTGTYQVSYFGLRRDEVVLLYVRQQLWDRFIATQRTATQRVGHE